MWPGPPEPGEELPGTLSGHLGFLPTALQIAEVFTPFYRGDY